MSGQEGTAFILINDAIPGFARFEYTTKGDVAAKVQKLNNGDLPVPFRVYYAATVKDCSLLERNLHYLFADHRDDRSSRFFRINPDLLRAAIELAAQDAVELSDEELGLAPEVRARMDQIRASHDASRFGAFSVRPDTVLHFSRDMSITCTALESGLVKYDDEEVTPAEATLRAMRKIGFDWAEVSATDYWVRQELRPADGSRANVPSALVEGGFQKVPEARNDAGESPVMFIRNRKI